MDLTCPKCRAAMRHYERSGVTIDQCTECRGVFLDRGELEKLMDAETSYYGGGQQAAPPPSGGYPSHQSGYPPQQPVRPQRRGWGSPDSPDSPSYHGGYHRRRKGGFLGDLFG
ncbi:TFIIB-type zinc ribbon-containing protein [Desertihabitans aurantiacus]|uniref:TFIIB-type zinc ribbon-containing protein n=1 Tax=Desertihabitans aurantiacus TaxID=2282477 RepID=UPI000DF7EEEC|nr:zf-TFIIB domain-containing protein [Desertihabitans aurantiacus]